MKMKILLYILTYFCATKCASINTTTTTPNITTTIVEVLKPAIEELEKQKGEIYSQINSAIEDTIKTLEKTNDTDAKEGIAYMKELMSQIQEFNGTELILDDDTASSHENCSDEIQNEIKPENNTDFLQSGRRKIKKPVYTGYEKIKDAILSFGDLKKLGTAGAGKIVSKKKQARLENRIALQKKLDAWMAQREAEKAKIREYKSRMAIVRLSAVTERCPDFGEVKAKKKKKGSSSIDKRPCCRKCCKLSYMGCLK